jgi:hypothetical protein
MVALGLPTGPVTAVLMAALIVHGIQVGPQLVNEHPDVFWGFVASMYVGNVLLLLLNLPLVGVFVNVLRIPYSYLYPLVIMFCVIGVYTVNNSIVDVWIMLIMGVLGYFLRKFGLDPAPLVLGPRGSAYLEPAAATLIMSDGNWHFFGCPTRAVRASRRGRSGAGTVPSSARRPARQAAEAEAGKGSRAGQGWASRIEPTLRQTGRRHAGFIGAQNGNKSHRVREEPMKSRVSRPGRGAAVVLQPPRRRPPSRPSGSTKARQHGAFRLSRFMTTPPRPAPVC